MAGKLCSAGTSAGKLLCFRRVIMTACLLGSMVLDVRIEAGSPSSFRGQILEFSASWCQPCQQMGPIVSRLERAGLPIRTVDIAEEPGLARRFQIRNIPTFLLIIDGKEVDRIVGTTTEVRLKDLVSRIPASQAPLIRKDPDVRSPAALKTGKEGPTFRGNLDDANAGREDALPHSPLQATVRIRIRDRNGTNYGTGTIVESRPEQTLILTCGHILRNLGQEALISVDCFSGSGKMTLRGTPVGADLEADVGLISIQTPDVLPSVPVSARSARVGERVLSIGCSSGEDPTMQKIEVTALNRYMGPQNIECTGQPVQGRSGGGLFNAENHLVGICIAADPETHRGLYCGLKPALELLKQHGLDRLLPDSKDRNLEEGEQQASPAEGSLVKVEGETKGRGDSAGGGIDPSVAAVLQDLARGDESAEIICIIRPVDGSKSGSRVVVVNRASRKFVEYLTTELGHRLPNGVDGGRLSSVQTTRVPQETLYRELHRPVPETTQHHPVESVSAGRETELEVRPRPRPFRRFQRSKVSSPQP